MQVRHTTLIVFAFDFWRQIIGTKRLISNVSHRSTSSTAAGRSVNNDSRNLPAIRLTKPARELAGKTSGPWGSGQCAAVTRDADTRLTRRTRDAAACPTHCCSVMCGFIWDCGLPCMSFSRGVEVMALYKMASTR